MIERTQNIYTFISDNGIDAALIFSPENRRYYTGFTGSTGYAVFPAGKEAVFFTDTRYTVQAHSQCAGYQILPLVPEQSLFAFLAKHKVRRLAVEAGFITWQFAQTLLHEGGIAELLDLGEVIKRDRVCKSKEELSFLRTACAYTDDAFAHILTVIREGMTESEINFELQACLRRFDNVERTMDRYIVASGPRGSMPHGVASPRAVQNGDFVTLDFGCCVGGYWSDMTRTVCLGKASAKQRDIYESVRIAQQAGVAAAAPGKTGREVDAVARNLIKASGYGNSFSHGLGHGLGLTVREAPYLTQSGDGGPPLEKGMVVTVEPGIYLDEMGVRIEDDVVITETGCESLTSSPRELIEL